MRYIKQFSIIMTITLVGELLKELLPFMVPASIYGLFIMLVLLMTGILKVEHIKDTSDFLLDIMPIMFVPASVGLMDSWGILQDILVPVLVVSIVGTLIVMVVTAKTTEAVVKLTGADMTCETKTEFTSCEKTDEEVREDE